MSSFSIVTARLGSSVRLREGSHPQDISNHRYYLCATLSTFQIFPNFEFFIALIHAFFEARLLVARIRGQSLQTGFAGKVGSVRLSFQAEFQGVQRRQKREGKDKTSTGMVWLVLASDGQARRTTG